MTATTQETFTVTYDQLVRLGVLGERARNAADELKDADEEIGAIVLEIAGPFADDADADAFFEPFDSRVHAATEATAT